MNNSMKHLTEEVTEEWVEMMREEMHTITSFAVPKDHNLISSQFESEFQDQIPTMPETGE